MTTVPGEHAEAFRVTAVNRAAGGAGAALVRERIRSRTLVTSQCHVDHVKITEVRVCHLCAGGVGLRGPDGILTRGDYRTGVNSAGKVRNPRMTDRSRPDGPSQAD